MRTPTFILDCGLVTPLGLGKATTAQALIAGKTQLVQNNGQFIGAIEGELPELPAELEYLDCRNNRLMQVALLEIAPSVAKIVEKYGKERVALILGTSTSGIASGEVAYENYLKTGIWQENYHYQQQELGSISQFVAEFLGVNGPIYTIATACSSSAKVFASARRLIEAGIVDAAIVGGADTLCQMTQAGFASLQITSSKLCNPFSVNRDGINIGEGAAAFLLSKEEGAVQLLSVGETSDAYHQTAPDPDGNGAEKAMILALADAKLAPSDICYINLHGTATPLNDAMESKAVSSVFGSNTLCSSTKAMTGHLLGAAGACEAAFLWLMLNPATNLGFLPPHLWDGKTDPALPPLNFVKPMTKIPEKKILAMLSNSFGFGGSNASIILGRTQ